tara:strand:+ start:144 stop:428 length:285 start_codon:yes stop_codon:yes gene_type:complete
MDPGPSAASALETDRLCSILTTEENRVRTARSSVQIAEGRLAEERRQLVRAEQSAGCVRAVLHREQDALLAGDVASVLYRTPVSRLRQVLDWWR